MIDKPLFASIIVLFTISLMMSYSLSTFTVLYHDFSGLHFFIRQIVAVAIGISLMVFLSRLDPDKWFVLIGFTLFIVSFLAMIAMPFMPESLVKSVLGAKRWIRFGPVSLSPVEFFKVGFVFFLSWSFSRKMLNHGKLSLWSEAKVVFPYMLIFGVAVMFIAVFQKDLGQVMVLAVMLVILFSFAGRSIKLFFLNITVGTLGFIALIQIAPHRMARIKSWWSTVQDGFLDYFPSSMASDFRVEVSAEPYQISHSLNSIHNGGIFGQGLGNGQFKLGYLSEVHTDFILAGITEELGYIGLVVVSVLMLVIVFRIFRIASRVENPAYHLFSMGVGLVVILSFLVNSYGISGLMPIKGIAVPFLSYGGSHIMASSLGIGLVLMISKKTTRKDHKKV
ncbi:MAG TPA: cell division protein FtsW [Sulfurovum sp.]|nr:cell division protein FtsW [Sulfurovum sp.]